jgi:hypothetical protein
MPALRRAQPLPGRGQPSTSRIAQHRLVKPPAAPVKSLRTSPVTAPGLLHGDVFLGPEIRANDKWCDEQGGEGTAGDQTLRRQRPVEPVEVVNRNIPAWIGQPAVDPPICRPTVAQLAALSHVIPGLGTVACTHVSCPGRTRRRRARWAPSRRTPSGRSASASSGISHHRDASGVQPPDRSARWAVRGGRSARRPRRVNQPNGGVLASAAGSARSGHSVSTWVQDAAGLLWP